MPSTCQDHRGQSWHIDPAPPLARPLIRRKEAITASIFLFLHLPKDADCDSIEQLKIIRTTYINQHGQKYDIA
ncbi:hypothetical protein ACHAW5_009064 [Stephanodiscus triporus]